MHTIPHPDHPLHPHQAPSAPAFPPPLVLQAAAQVTALAGTPFDPVRVGKALDLALTGAVTLLPDGTAEVRSGDTTYVVTDACTCACPDVKYRGTLCKHQLAAAIARETAALLAQDNACLPASAALAQASRPDPWAGQQAPATCYVECQVGPLRLGYTFRATTDAEVLTRLRAQLPQLRALLAAGEASAPAQGAEPVAPPAPPEPAPALTPEAVQALVQQAVRQALAAQAPSAAPPSQTPVNGHPANGQAAASPAPPPSVPAPPEGWCPVHQVPMRQRQNSQGAWWSHRQPDGSYCKGQPGA